MGPAASTHLDRKLTFLLAGMATLLVITIALAWMVVRMMEAAQEQRHASYQRLLILEKTLNSLHMAETSQRGYLLTDDARHRAGWEQAAAEARSNHQSLAQTYGSDAEAADLLRNLAHWQRMKLEELEDTVQAQQALGREMAQSLAHADYGRRYMARLQSIIGDIKALEARRNAALETTVNSRRQVAYMAAFLLFVVACTSSFVVLRVMRREAAARHRLHLQMEHDAFHDALTLLPNRRYFLEELERAITRARRQQRAVALLFIDLDGFKKVNDSLGHKMGDLLLQHVSKRFRDVVRQSDLLARLGGDEFAVVMDVDERSNAFALAQRMIDVLRDPLLEAHPGYLVSASVGIALFPDDTDDGTTLLAQADQAMYRAKRQGKARVVSLSE